MCHGIPHTALVPLPDGMLSHRQKCRSECESGCVWWTPYLDGDALGYPYNSRRHFCRPPLPRRVLPTVIGVALIIGSVVTWAALLFPIPPFQFWVCTPGMCSTYEPLVVLWMSVPFVLALGVALAFFGFFGRDLVFGPLFVLGMIPFISGAVGTAWSELRMQICATAFCPAGYVFDIGPYFALLVVGSLMISLQVAIWKRKLPTATTAQQSY